MSKSRWPVFWLLLALTAPVAAMDHSHHAAAGGGEAAWLWLLALVPLLAFRPALRRLAPLVLVLLLFQHHSMGAMPGTVSHEPPPPCCTLAQSTEPPAPPVLAMASVSLRLKPLPPPSVPTAVSSWVPPIRAPPSSAA